MTMTAELESDFSLIRDPNAQRHPAYLAFKSAMKGRAYGSGALNDAWFWFKRGWIVRDSAKEESLDDLQR